MIQIVNEIKHHLQVENFFVARVKQFSVSVNYLRVFLIEVVLSTLVGVILCSIACRN